LASFDISSKFGDFPSMQKKIMLLGSGELGKEFVISAQRLGLHVVAVDRYADAPAMAVANESEVTSICSTVMSWNALCVSISPIS
jgi:formate-dependent phosphoribosylglycinamide formyltransferase (GAR transformylase)